MMKSTSMMKTELPVVNRRSLKAPHDLGIVSRIFDLLTSPLALLWKARHSTRKEALIAQLSKRLTPAEVKFYNDMKDLELSLLCADMPSEIARVVETGLVGAAGNEFGNTAELNVLNYKQSMESPYRDKYVEGISEKRYKMSRNEVFEEVNSFQAKVPLTNRALQAVSSQICLD
jgi:hypothetical protein